MMHMYATYRRRSTSVPPPVHCLERCDVDLDWEDRAQANRTNWKTCCHDRLAAAKYVGGHPVLAVVLLLNMDSLQLGGSGIWDLHSVNTFACDATRAFSLVTVAPAPKSAL